MSKSRCAEISPCQQGRCPHGKVCGNENRCIDITKKRWEEVCGHLEKEDDERQDYMGRRISPFSGNKKEFLQWQKKHKNKQPWGTKTPNQVRRHLLQLRKEMVQEETKIQDRLITIQHRLDGVDRELDKIATAQNNCRFVRNREGTETQRDRHRDIGVREGTCEGECPSVGDARSLCIPASPDGTAAPVGYREEAWNGPRLPCNCVSQDQYESDKPNYDQWRNKGIVDEEIYPSAASAANVESDFDDDIAARTPSAWASAVDPASGRNVLLSQDPRENVETAGGFR